MEYIIDYKRHNTMDIKEYFEEIYNYFKKQDNIDRKLLNKSDIIERLLKNIERKYGSLFKEK